ncbi:hypothetical protein BPT24_067 [Tenacibaculum phage pT24]|uniref:Uncharacterized protein n=1 Tax=Tenacibaculum phage pT24 TaxID=1880590 RepID=A0A1B4XWJ5_9CAUD|nr:hypothetical protein HYP10_gp067 [Tenacibaculum phage pT24]BAV39190.1 hypothetical protein BPT24_067 [Tenacibaculum phage pT24]
MVNLKNMNCECKHIVATDGIAEPFVLIDGKWKDLINLGFKCPKCGNEIEFSNNKNYPNMWDVEI